MKLSICFTDDIKTYKNGCMVMVLGVNLYIYVFFMILPYFKVFINIHEYANYIFYISDHRKKGMCLSFNLVTRLVL